MSLPLERRASLETLAERLGHKFQELTLLDCALTHRSHAHETGRGPHYERLEILGDSLISFLTTEAIFNALPRASEADISRGRAILVSTSALALVGEKVDLGRYLSLGKNEDQSGMRRNRTILADCFEAVVAALYLDGGIDAARRLVLETIGPSIVAYRETRIFEPDPKSKLSALVRETFSTEPIYAVERSDGPPHRKTYHVTVAVAGEVLGRGLASSRREAEKAAALWALSNLGAPPCPRDPGMSPEPALTPDALAPPD